MLVSWWTVIFFVQCKHLHCLYGVELFAVNNSFSKASYNITQNSVTLSGELLDSSNGEEDVWAVVLEQWGRRCVSCWTRAVGKKTCELLYSSSGEEDVWAVGLEQWGRRRVSCCTQAVGKKMCELLDSSSGEEDVWAVGLEQRARRHVSCWTRAVGKKTYELLDSSSGEENDFFDAKDGSV